MMPRESSGSSRMVLWLIAREEIHHHRSTRIIPTCSQTTAVISIKMGCHRRQVTAKVKVAIRSRTTTPSLRVITSRAETKVSPASIFLTTCGRAITTVQVDRRSRRKNQSARTKGKALMNKRSSLIYFASTIFR